VLVDVVLTLADGGNPLSDLAAVRNQPELFGPVASDPTAWRVVDSWTTSTVRRSRPPTRPVRALPADPEDGEWMLPRADSASCTHGLVQALRDRDVECSIGPRLGTL